MSVSFKIFLEKQERNRLRKQELKSQGVQPNFTSPEDLAQQAKDYVDYIKSGTFGPEDYKTQEIYDQYRRLRSVLPPRAEKFLQDKTEEYLARVKKPTIGNSKKVYEKMGVSVFVDQYVDPSQDFSKGSYNYRIVVRQVDYLLGYIKDLLPNRKPNIIITDVNKNPVTRGMTSKHSPIAALYGDRLIYIDYLSIDDQNTWIHEYSHLLADMAPDRIDRQLFKAYNDVLNIFYKKAKIKKLELEPRSVQDNSQVMMANANRMRISKKIGFPDEYGLTNADEFFAVMIEHWKEMPNTAATYRFKQIVKKILNQL